MERWAGENEPICTKMIHQPFLMVDNAPQQSGNANGPAATAATASPVSDSVQPNPACTTCQHSSSVTKLFLSWENTSALIRLLDNYILYISQLLWTSSCLAVGSVSFSSLKWWSLRCFEWGTPLLTPPFSSLRSYMRLSWPYFTLRLAGTLKDFPPSIYSLSLSHTFPLPSRDTTEGINSSWLFNISHILGLRGRGEECFVWSMFSRLYIVF